MTSEEAADLQFEFRMPEDRVRSAGLDFDGKTVRREAIPTETGVLSWTPRGPLREGEHTLELRVDRPILPPAVFSWSFSVDDTAPAIPFPEAQTVPIDQPVTITGTLAAGEQLWLDGAPVDVADDGTLSLSWDLPPVGAPMEVRVVDAAGNMSEGTLALPVAYPEVRGLHLRAIHVADPEIFASVLELVDKGMLTAVEIDLKEEDGLVGYESSIPAVSAVGADAAYYDLEAAVAELQSHGAHVIGRLVAFNDTRYARWAVDNGFEDRVVQTRDGEPVQRNEGMFLNFANPEVQAYISAIAVEAANAGVDDVLLDYVRRPDGSADEMVFAGLEGTPEEGIASFLEQLHPQIRSRGAYLGASVFGIAAVAPTDIAQDVPAMANHLDYVAPMLYPSHFSENNYNVAVPNEDPYTIVARALADFIEQVESHGIGVVPWLQDFDFDNVSYDYAKVRSEIDAVCESGVGNHLLWNAAADYTVDALGDCS